MAKVDRYYVDSDGPKELNIVIRDRISPLGKLDYPTDIAVDIAVGMFKNHIEALTIADKICALLNKD